MSPEDCKRSYFADAGIGMGAPNAFFANFHFTAELNKGRALMFVAAHADMGDLFDFFSDHSEITVAEFYFMGLGKIRKSKNALLVWSVSPSYTYVTHYK